MVYKAWIYILNPHVKDIKKKSAEIPSIKQFCFLCEIVCFAMPDLSLLCQAFKKFI